MLGLNIHAVHPCHGLSLRKQVGEDLDLVESTVWQLADEASEAESGLKLNPRDPNSPM